MIKTKNITKGLDIRLNGEAQKSLLSLSPVGLYGFCPDNYAGLKPKVVVREGDKVLVGSPLFVNKDYPEINYVSSISGIVREIVRGDRRKVLCVKVEADGEQKTLAVEKTPDAVAFLASAGLLGLINQMPYAVAVSSMKFPQSIFVSTFRDMPLAADVDYCIEEDMEYFSEGIKFLTSIAPVYLGIRSGRETDYAKFDEMENVTVTAFRGRCPAGNVNVQINHTQPLNKGDLVWTISPEVVVYIGNLINTGSLDFSRRIALCGSEVVSPSYYKVWEGQSISSIVDGKLLDNGRNKRIVNGNVLTGIKTDLQGFLSSHAHEITVIPEGDDIDEMLGWIMPRLSQFSVSRSYLSWLLPRKRYSLDARIKGGKRHMIMSGEYDKVLPMDIYPEYLIKAILTGDIDKMEQLGIYEVAPEDFALAEFVCSSKQELQRIVREGLDILRKENA